MSDDFIFTSDNGMALIHSKPYTEYVDEDGPTLILSMEKIKQNHENLSQVIKDTFAHSGVEVSIYYSMKTNSHPSVLETIKNIDCGIQVVSGHELGLVNKCGFDPSKIILGGLGKEKKTIEYALKLGISCIYMDSIEEFQILKDIEMEASSPTRLGIISSLGRTNKVGIHLDGATVKILGEMVDSKEMRPRLKCLHHHAGTQIVKEEPILESVKQLHIMSSMLKDYCGVGISSINLGGGFPEANNLKISQLKKLMERIRDEFTTLNGGFQEPIELIFEPGRYLVADAGIVLCKINQIKNSFQRRENEDRSIILNAGINVINPISKARNRFLVANQMNESYNTTFNISGSLPTSIDLFTKHYPLPANTSVGDHVIITNAGAYTIPFLMDFCTKPPKIIILDEN